MIDRYYYYLLKDDCRILYDNMLDGIKRRYSEINCNGQVVCVDDVTATISAVEYDNPDLFYVDFAKYHLNYSEETKRVLSIQFTYLYSVADVFSLQVIVDKSCQTIISKISVNGCSDYKKVCKLHDFIIDNVEYFKEALAMPGSFEWYRAGSILGLFLDKKAICSGISRAFKYLLNRIGLRAIVVAGFALNQNDQKEGHEWNIVLINGKSYHIDMTWDITESFDNRRSYNYFNLSDKLIFRDHFTDSDLPKCCYDDDNYFERNLSAFKNKKSFNKYIGYAYSRCSGEFYARIDYNCDINEEAKKIENYISEHYIRSLVIRTIIYKRQNIIRVLVSNGQL